MDLSIKRILTPLRKQRGTIWEQQLPLIDLQKLRSIFEGYDNRNGSKFSIQLEYKAYQSKLQKKQKFKSWIKKEMKEISVKKQKCDEIDFGEDVKEKINVQKEEVVNYPVSRIDKCSVNAIRKKILSSKVQSDLDKKVQYKTASRGARLKSWLKEMYSN